MPQPFDTEEHTLDTILSGSFTENCFMCKHFNMDAWTCTAYPAGDMPPAFIVGQRIHNKPEEGDHGIMFEARSR